MQPQASSSAVASDANREQHRVEPQIEAQASGAPEGQATATLEEGEHLDSFNGVLLPLLFRDCCEEGKQS